MRKITQEALKAFKNGENYKNSNTIVSPSNTMQCLYLHGHLIATLRNGKLNIDNCGYFTQTTKERLNGILEQYSLGKIKQIKGKWYIVNGESKDLFTGKGVFNLRYENINI